MKKLATISVAFLVAGVAFIAYDWVQAEIELRRPCDSPCDKVIGYGTYIGPGMLLLLASGVIFAGHMVNRNIKTVQ